MAAPKGHKRWGNPLNPKKYTPEELWQIAIEYFEWCDNNPISITEQSRMPQKLTNEMAKTLKPNQINKFMKQIVELPTQRAYSIEGFCVFANMSKITFYNYESKEYNKEDQTYLNVCSKVREIIDDQHFTGGMANLFNANIVTRKLGLKEAKELDHKSSDGSMSPKVNIVVRDKKTASEIDKLDADN